MRKFPLLFPAFLFLLNSCESRDQPRGILPAEKMEAVIYDMMRADQFLGDFVLNSDSTLSREQESMNYYREILALHKIDQETFRESFYYYRARPGLLREIMDSIQKRDPLLRDPGIVPSPGDSINTSPPPLTSPGSHQMRID